MQVQTSTTMEDALQELKKQARKLRADLPYSGDVTPTDTYDYLKQHGGMLVDVRSLPEWQFVGVPDVKSTPAQCVQISWKLYPQFAPNPEFARQLAAAGAEAQTALFFICRTGGRSLDAACVMAQQGYAHCFNVSDGFEGDHDPQGHRGTVSGWKASKLPWVQG